MTKTDSLTAEEYIEALNGYNYYTKEQIEIIIKLNKVIIDAFGEDIRYFVMSSSGQSKNPEYNTVRIIIAGFLNSKGFNHKQIAYVICRDRTTTYNSLEKYEEGLLQQYHPFKSHNRSFELFKEKYFKI